MNETILTALEMVASLDNFVAICGGVVFGIIMGAIPGMTGTMAVAIALPFTFQMAPVTGILLLVGIYKGSMYGGSISAILIKTPGTAASACTVLDGYPLARAGKADKALRIALYASCIADLISSIVLIFFAGIVAGIALQFGPPEFFMLICFSMTIIAGVSGASLTKGIVSAALGLLTATVGMDIIYGSGRFTFGDSNLMAGIGFIPILIGLFALPEIYNQMLTRTVVGERLRNIADRGLSFQELRRCLRSILRGSFIGVALGAIPGIGGAPAAFLSYSEAKRKSRNPDRFGKGEIEGIAASESGNNGVCGATLIPLLALGIPGDVVTAVILGAFMIHGLRPGPLLFEQNIDLISALFIGILVSSAVLFIAGSIGSRLLSRVTDIPKGILFPSVFVVSLFGTYAINNSMFDIMIMLIMGVVGFGMLRFAIPAAPFLIAFVLGPLLEDNLRRTLLLGRGDPAIFFRSGISIFFFILTCVALVLLVWRQYSLIRK